MPAPSPTGRIARGFDRQVPQGERRFFYLPFMHSEMLADQERCVELARAYGDDEFMTYAELHADIVRRFGRFPHRNPTLGARHDAGGAGLSRRRRLRRVRSTAVGLSPKAGSPYMNETAPEHDDARGQRLGTLPQLVQANSYGASAAGTH